MLHRPCVSLSGMLRPAASSSLPRQPSLRTATVQLIRRRRQLKELVLNNLACRQRISYRHNVTCAVRWTAQLFCLVHRIPEAIAERNERPAHEAARYSTEHNLSGDNEQSRWVALWHGVSGPVGVLCLVSKAFEHHHNPPQRGAPWRCRDQLAAVPFDLKDTARMRVDDSPVQSVGWYQS